MESRRHGWAGTHFYAASAGRSSDFLSRLPSIATFVHTLRSCPPVLAVLLSAIGLRLRLRAGIALKAQWRFAKNQSLTAAGPRMLISIATYQSLGRSVAGTGGVFFRSWLITSGFLFSRLQEPFREFFSCFGHTSRLERPCCAAILKFRGFLPEGVVALPLSFVRRSCDRPHKRFHVESNTSPPNRRN